MVQGRNDNTSNQRPVYRAILAVRRRLKASRPQRWSLLYLTRTDEPGQTFKPETA